MKKFGRFRPLASAKRLIRALLSMLPYGITNGALIMLTTVGCGARRLLRREGGPLARAVSRLGLSYCREGDEAVHVLATRFMSWRVAAFSRFNEGEFERHCEIIGLDKITNRGGKGVVLINSHYGAGRVVPLAIARMGLTVHVLEPEDFLLTVGGVKPDTLKVISLREGNAFWLKQLAQARSVLAEGGVVHIAVDGLQGRGGCERRFFGVTRKFHASFAQLAVQTGANVIPVFARQLNNGDVVVECEPELDPSHESAASSAEVVDAFVDAYAGRLANRWRADPSQILARHLNYMVNAQAQQDKGRTAFAGPGDEGGPGFRPSDIRLREAESRR